MFNNRKKVYFSRYAWLRRKKEERRRRRKKMNKIESFVFGFSTVLKVSRTNRVDLALE